jgi:hypothetical protein
MVFRPAASKVRCATAARLTPHTFPSGVVHDRAGYRSGMTDEQRNEPDPSEVQPTDNSSGTPVDLERLDKVKPEAVRAEEREGGAE